MEVLSNQPDYCAEAFGVGDEEPIVKVRGEVDLVTAPWLASLLTEVIRHERRRIIIDLTDASLFGARGVAVIAAVRNQLPDDCGVILRSPNPVVHWVLQITEMDGPCIIETSRNAGQTNAFR
jgi:anti-anti-sigma factor